VCAPFVRAWDSRGFTPSPGPIKYAFWECEIYSNPKERIIRCVPYTEASGKMNCHAKACELNQKFNMQIFFD